MNEMRETLIECALKAVDADVGVFLSPNMEILSLKKPDRICDICLLAKFWTNQIYLGLTWQDHS